MAQNSLIPFKGIALCLLLFAAQPVLSMNNEMKEEENNKVRPLPKVWTKDPKPISKNNIEENKDLVYVIDFLGVRVSDKKIAPKDKLLKSKLQWKEGDRGDITCDPISYGEGIIVTTNNSRLNLELKWTLDIPEDEMKWVSRSTHISQDLSHSTPMIEVRIDLPRSWFVCESPPCNPIVTIYNN